MFSNLIDQKLLSQLLKDFKDSHIIYDYGTIYNYTVGAMLYDYIIWLNEFDVDDSPKISFLITDDEKKVLWKYANKGLLISLWDREPERVKLLAEATPEYKELHIQIRKQIITKIYKTKLVEHLLNKLADNGQYIDIENQLNAIYKK